MSHVINADPQPYVFSTLARDEIQILLLFPISFIGLRCNLRVSKHQEIEYEAVSFTQGPPNLAEQLRIGFDTGHRYESISGSQSYALLPP